MKRIYDSNDCIYEGPGNVLKRNIKRTTAWERAHGYESPRYFYTLRAYLKYKENR